MKWKRGIAGLLAGLMVVTSAPIGQVGILKVHATESEGMVGNQEEEQCRCKITAVEFVGVNEKYVVGEKVELNASATIEKGDCSFHSQEGEPEVIFTYTIGKNDGEDTELNKNEEGKYIWEAGQEGAYRITVTAKLQEGDPGVSAEKDVEIELQECMHKVKGIDFPLSELVIPIQDGEEGVTHVLNAKAIVSDNGCEVKHEEEEAVCTYEVVNAGTTGAEISEEEDRGQILKVGSAGTLQIEITGTFDNHEDSAWVERRTILVADKNELSGILLEAEELKGTDYVSSTWDEFQKATKYGRDVLTKDAAAGEVLEAIRKLEAAQNNLVRVIKLLKIQVKEKPVAGMCVGDILGHISSEGEMYETEKAIWKVSEGPEGEEQEKLEEDEKLGENADYILGITLKADDGHAFQENDTIGEIWVEEEKENVEALKFDEENKTLTVTYRFSTSSCQHKVDAIDFGLSGIVIPIQDGEEGVTQVLNAKAIVSDNGCEVKHEEEEAVCTYELEDPGDTGAEISEDNGDKILKVESAGTLQIKIKGTFGGSSREETRTILVADKNELSGILLKVEELNGTDYIPDTWAKLQGVKEYGREVLEDEGASAREVSRVIQHLKAAKGNLVKAIQLPKIQVKEKPAAGMSVEEVLGYISSEGEGYKTNKTVWKVFEVPGGESQEELETGDSLGEDVTYILKITLEANEKCAFREGASIREICVVDRPVGVGSELDEEHKTLTVTYRFRTSSCLHKVDAIDFGLSGIVIPIQDGEEGVTQVLNAKASVSDNECEVKHEKKEAVCTYEVVNAGSTGAEITEDNGDKILKVESAGTLQIKITGRFDGREDITCMKEINILVANKNDLNRDLNDVEGFSQDTYTPDTWAKFSQVRSNAKIILEDEKASAADVNSAIENLDSAKKTLVTKAAAAKKELQEKLNKVQELKQSDYTKATWGVLEQAIESAEGVIKNQGATEAQLKNAKADLEAACRNLKLQAEADREAAAKALEQAKQAGNRALSAEKAAYEKGQGLYTDASWSAYKKAYEALKTSVSKNDASAINGCRDTLTKAKADLKEVRKVTVASIRTIERTGYEKVKLSIKKTKAAKAYLIFRSTKKNGSYQLMDMTKKTSFTDGKAKAGKTYYYKAVPIKGTAGKGKKKTYLPIMDGYTNKIQPSDLKKLVLRSGKAKSIQVKGVGRLKITRSGQVLALKWTAIKDAKRIQVSYSSNGKSGWKILSSANQNGKIALTTMKIRSADAYWYRVTYEWPAGEKSTKAVRK